MGKIKDFFTKIGVTDSDGEEGFQNTTADIYCWQIPSASKDFGQAVPSCEKFW